MNMEQLTHYQSKLAFEMDSFDLFTAVQAGKKKITIVDGRAAAAFEAEHIPGAVNIPHRGICVDSTSHLDPDQIYVCYCDGIGCNASTKAALKLLTLGFDVRELIGGLDWWIRDGYRTDGAAGRAGTDIICGC